MVGHCSDSGAKDKRWYIYLLYHYYIRGKSCRHTTTQKVLCLCITVRLFWALHVFYMEMTIRLHGLTRWPYHCQKPDKRMWKINKTTVLSLNSHHCYDSKSTRLHVLTPLRRIAGNWCYLKKNRGIVTKDFSSVSYIRIVKYMKTLKK